MDGFGASERRRRGVGARSRPGPAEVRLARRDELDAVASIFGPALEAYRGGGADWIVDAYLEDLVDVRRRFDLAETFVATIDGRIAGTVAFYCDVALEGWSNFPRGWAGFRALAVDPSARGAGVGRALVEECIRRGREVGARTLGIHTIALLAEAMRLYERLGFVRCPEYDLLAADVFPAEQADDMVGVAFRYELSAVAIGPRTVIVPGVTT